MSIRTGDQYLDSLKDSREIIYEGKAVDVTTHPDFVGASQAVAQYYDFQNLPAVREVMTYQTEDGQTAATSFLEARSKADLWRRSAAYAAWAEVTCGFMSRSPDYMNTAMASLASVSARLAAVDPKIAVTSRRLYEAARAGDTCLTHTFADPFKMPVPEAGDPDTLLKVVRETSDGIYVSGKRGIATLAPFSNANMNLGAIRAPRWGGGSGACSFIVPVGAKGTRWICRDAMTTGRPHYSSPLTDRADEFDCVAVFDECFIPFDDLYVYLTGPDAQAAGIFAEKSLTSLRHHTIVRFIEKTKFFIGLGHLLAESSRINRFVNITERLGEMVNILRTMESFAIAAVEGAERDPDTGVYMPQLNATKAATRWCGVYYQRMIAIILELGASRYISTPQEATFDALGEAIEKHFRGATLNGKDNVALHKLAWDVAGTEFATRQCLYEKFHFGDWSQGLVHEYAAYNKEQAIGMVRRLLSHPAQGRERFPVTGA